MFNFIIVVIAIGLGLFVGYKMIDHDEREFEEDVYLDVF